MAGMWPMSRQQMLDGNGKPYSGARATFFAADSSDPLDVFQDYSLGTLHSNPVVADAYGRFPNVFLDEADGFYRHRVTTSGGTVLFDDRIMPVIGPAGGGGGSEVPVSESSLWQTGDLKHRFADGIHDGWVRANGRTVGAASSGATERANEDTEDLFTLLWEGTSNTICPVSGGRGASAAADFAANKTIQLPDLRGRALAGLDDMGQSAAGRLNAAVVATGDATTLGSSGGEDRHTLTLAESPAHDHGGTTGSAGAHNHNDGSYNVILKKDGTRTAGSFDNDSGRPNLDVTSTLQAASNHTHSITSAGGGTAHNNMPPFVLATIYIKL